MDEKTKLELIRRMIISIYEFEKFESKGFIQGFVSAVDIVVSFKEGVKNEEKE